MAFSRSDREASQIPVGAEVADLEDHQGSRHDRRRIGLADRCGTWYIERAFNQQGVDRRTRVIGSLEVSD
jgi:hypothetical protein